MVHSRGFTLLELMVVVAVIAISAALAAPSFERMIAVNEMSSVSNSVTGLLTSARSEAIKRNVRIRVVPVGATAGTGLGASAWTAGLWVWWDANGNGAPNLAENESSEVLLRTSRIGPAIEISGPAQAIEFRGTGLGTAATTVKLCHRKYDDLGRRFSITAGGQISSVQEACNA